MIYDWKYQRHHRRYNGRDLVFWCHAEAQCLYGLLVEILIFVIVYVGGGPGGRENHQKTAIVAIVAKRPTWETDVYFGLNPFILVWEILTNICYYWEGGQSKVFDFGCLYFSTFPFSVLVGLGIYTTDQDFALGGFDLSVEYQIWKSLDFFSMGGFPSNLTSIVFNLGDQNFGS